MIEPTNTTPLQTTPTPSTAELYEEIIKAAADGLALQTIEACPRINPLIHAARELITKKYHLEAKACLELLSIRRLRNFDENTANLSEARLKGFLDSAKKKINSKNYPLAAAFLAYYITQSGTQDSLIFSKYEAVRKKAIDVLENSYYEELGITPPKKHLSKADIQPLIQPYDSACQQLDNSDRTEFYTSCELAIDYIQRLINQENNTESFTKDCHTKLELFLALIRNAIEHDQLNIKKYLHNEQYDHAFALCKKYSAQYHSILQQFSKYPITHSTTVYVQQEISQLRSFTQTLQKYLAHNSELKTATDHFKEKRYRACMIITAGIVNAMQKHTSEQPFILTAWEKTLRQAANLNKMAELKPSVDAHAITLQEQAGKTNQLLKNQKARTHKNLCINQLVQISQSISNITSQYNLPSLTTSYDQLFESWLSKLKAILNKQLAQDQLFANRLFDLGHYEQCKLACLESINNINTTIRHIGSTKEFPQLFKLQQTLIKPFVKLAQKAFVKTEEIEPLVALYNKARQQLKAVDDDGFYDTCESALNYLQTFFDLINSSRQYISNCGDMLNSFIMLMQQAASRYWPSIELTLYREEYAAAQQLCEEADEQFNQLLYRFSQYRIIQPLICAYKEQAAELNLYTEYLKALNAIARDFADAQKQYQANRLKSCKELCHALINYKINANVANLTHQNSSAFFQQPANSITAQKNQELITIYNRLAQQAQELYFAAELKPQADLANAELVAQCAAANSLLENIDEQAAHEQQQEICITTLKNIIRSQASIEEQSYYPDLTTLHHQLINQWLDKLNIILETRLKNDHTALETLLKTKQFKQCEAACQETITQIDLLIYKIGHPAECPELSLFQEKLIKPFNSLSQKACFALGDTLPPSEVSETTSRVSFLNKQLDEKPCCNSMFFGTIPNSPPSSTKEHRRQAKENGRPASERKLPPGRFPSLS